MVRTTWWARKKRIKYDRVSGVDFGPVDPVKYAEAFGATGLRIDRPDQITATLRQSVRHSWTRACRRSRRLPTECEIVRAGVRGQHFVKSSQKRRRKIRWQKIRKETDSLGEVNVPADKLWGRSNTALARAFQHWQGFNPSRNDHRLRDFKESSR